MKCGKEGVGNSTAGARFRNSKAGPGFVWRLQKYFVKDRMVGWQSNGWHTAHGWLSSRKIVCCIRILHKYLLCGRDDWVRFETAWTSWISTRGSTWRTEKKVWSMYRKYRWIMCWIQHCSGEVLEQHGRVRVLNQWRLDQVSSLQKWVCRRHIAWLRITSWLPRRNSADTSEDCSIAYCVGEMIEIYLKVDWQVEYLAEGVCQTWNSGVTL